MLSLRRSGCLSSLQSLSVSLSLFIAVAFSLFLRLVRFFVSAVSSFVSLLAVCRHMGVPSLSLFVSLSLSLYLYLSVSLCLSLSLCLSFSVSVPLCLSLSLSLSASLSLSLSLPLSLCLSVCVSVSFCLSLSLRVLLPPSAAAAAAGGAVNFCPCVWVCAGWLHCGRMLSVSCCLSSCCLPRSSVSLLSLRHLESLYLLLSFVSASDTSRSQLQSPLSPFGVSLFLAT